MKILKSEKGQSMVEFAIAFIFLLFFLIAIFEFSWFMGNKLLATHASREGARYAAIHSSEVSWKTDAKNVAHNALVINPPGYSKDSAIIISETTVDSSNDSVVVTISYNLSQLTNMVITSDGNKTFSIEAKTVMKKE